MSIRFPREWPPCTGACGLALALAAGCSNNPFRTTAPAAPVSLVPPPGVAAPAHTIQPPALPQTAPLQPSYSDVDPRQVENMLARSRQEKLLMQDELVALREQLASTSNQLAQARTAMPGTPAQPGSPLQPGAAPQPGMAARTESPLGPATAPQPGGPVGPAVMQSAMAQLSMPGIESRFDGNVVRIEIPSDRLFESGSANLLPGGAALLTQVSGEIERVYPGHFIGIEGHCDTEPLQNASWGSAHQLTAARASTVFEFFTTRTSLRQGQLFLVAHGSNHPVVSNATAAGRTRNRRVELVVYPERSGGGDG